MARSVGPVPFGAAARVWLRIGCISFGGPAGQIAILHREVVETHRWVDDAEFARALNFCMLLPGPEALQLAIYLGWRMHGIAGGIVAGLAFFVPAAVLLLALSYVYAAHGELAPVAAVLSGLKAVVVALVAQALVRIGGRALRGPVHWALAVGAFVGLQVLAMPFPVLLVLGAALGFAVLRPAGGAAARHGGGGSAPSGQGPVRASRDAGARVGGARHAGVVLLAGLALWLAPWSALRGLDVPVARDAYAFFTQVALVTFGGAYAVLAYVNQQLVDVQQWLTHADVVAGLALAETTPGPLVLVLQFYGFVAGWTQPGALAPLPAATLAALVTSWATFLPSFVLILVGAPYVERIAANARLAGMLEAVTALVVGVIASLALTIAVAVFAPQGWANPEWGRIALAVAAHVMLVRTRVGVHWVLLAGAVAGLAGV